MFQNARLKLTAWYLAIIMLVSVAFSGVIYHMVSSEVDRFEQIQRFRFRQPHPELVAEIKDRILGTLILVNSGVLIVSGGLGYFLAGRTLRPIKVMVEEQNQFVSDASHELRTPLTSLKSAFEVFLRGRDQSLSEAKTLARESLLEVNKLQQLSESLLQLSRKPSPLVKVSVKKTVAEAIKKIVPAAKAKRISVKDQSHPAFVRGVEIDLTNLLVILLDNAVKYGRSGGQIAISTKKFNGTTEIVVKDNGIGIAPADLPHIFDRFYRADTARSKRGSGGYGLGLSIAQNVVRAHQGSIRAESKPGQGSTFTVILKNWTG